VISQGRNARPGAAPALHLPERGSGMDTDMGDGPIRIFFVGDEVLGDGVL
jgi:hypothetical protein